MACIKYGGINECQIQYIVDTDSDISDLPTSTKRGAKGEDYIAKGSVALSIASGNIYVLNSSDTWTEVGG